MSDPAAEARQHAAVVAGRMRRFPTGTQVVTNYRCPYSPGIPTGSIGVVVEVFTETLMVEFTGLRVTRPVSPYEVETAT